MMSPLSQAGAEIVIGACNVDSTDDDAAAYAVSKGISVCGWQGMSKSEYLDNLAIVRSFEADLDLHGNGVDKRGIALYHCTDNSA